MEDAEGGESDPEEEAKTNNEDLGQKVSDVEEEDQVGEDSGTEDEQQKISLDEEEWHTCSEDEDEEERTGGSSSESSFRNSSRLLHKNELLDMFSAVHKGPRCKDGQLTVGLVGKCACSRACIAIKYTQML